MNRKDLIAANKKLRSKDESHLWPIRGRFNVTERAIARVRRFRAMGLEIRTPFEYELAVEEQISEIVNNEGNW